MIGKKAATLTTAIISIILVMGLFFGTYNYVNTNYISANITDELNYSESYTDLQESQSNLNNTIEDIKSAAQDISEADGSLLTVAWNGLTGVAATLKLFVNVIDVAINVWNALFPGLSFLPDWVKLLAEMALVIWIILIVIGAFKGESKT